MAKHRKSNDKPTTTKRTTAVNPSHPANKEGRSPKKSVSNLVETSGLTHFLKNKRLHIILIFVLSFLLYGNTLTHQYAQDDAIVITQNEFTKKGISGISDILKYDTFVGFFGKKKDLVAGGRYRPMSLVTFAVEWQFFGQNPMISHLLNILLYALTGVVLYLLLLLLFSNIRPPLEAYFIALAATVLFLAHPVHTEAVANIKGRDEIMALLGSLTTLYWAFKYFNTKKIAYLVGALVVYFLALLSKENSITFLAIIPLAFYFFHTEKIPFAKLITQTLPYLGVALIFLYIRAQVLGEAGSIGGEEAKELMNNPFIGLTASERYGTIFYTLGKYIALLFFPHPLTHDYYPRHIPVLSFSDAKVIFSILIYLALGIYALVRLPKKDPIAFGIIFFVAALSVVSNLFFSVGTNMSERLVFMPSVGFCLIIAVLLAKFLGQPKYKMATLATAVIAVLFFGKTVVRNLAWKDDFTLFSTDIHTSVNSAKLNNAMGGSLVDEAAKPENEAKRQQMYLQAIQYATKATEVHPTYESAYNQIGRAYFGLENYDKAAEYFRFLIQTFDSQHGKQNLYETAKAMNRKKEYAKAVPLFEEVKGYFPEDTELYGFLGEAYGNLNQHLKAIEQFEKITLLEPNNAKAYLYIGYGYMNLFNATKNQSYAQKGQSYIDKAKLMEGALN